MISYIVRVGQEEGEYYYLDKKGEPTVIDKKEAAQYSKDKAFKEADLWTNGYAERIFTV